MLRRVLVAVIAVAGLVALGGPDGRAETAGSAAEQGRSRPTQTRGVQIERLPAPEAPPSETSGGGGPVAPPSTYAEPVPAPVPVPAPPMQPAPAPSSTASATPPSPPPGAPTADAPPAVAACLRLPNLQADLVIAGDRRSFDRSLNRILSGSAQKVLVDLDQPLPRGQQPAYLQPWIKAVVENGGEAQELPLTCTRARGLVRWLVRSVQGVFSNDAVYRPAANYDVALYYDTGEEKLRQAVFTRRK